MRVSQYFLLLSCCTMRASEVALGTFIGSGKVAAVARLRAMAELTATRFPELFDAAFKKAPSFLPHDDNETRSIDRELVLACMIKLATQHSVVDTSPSTNNFEDFFSEQRLAEIAQGGCSRRLGEYKACYYLIARDLIALHALAPRLVEHLRGWSRDYSDKDMVVALAACLDHDPMSDLGGNIMVSFSMIDRINRIYQELYRAKCFYPAFASEGNNHAHAENLAPNIDAMPRDARQASLLINALVSRTVEAFPEKFDQAARTIPFSHEGWNPKFYSPYPGRVLAAMLESSFSDVQGFNAQSLASFDAIFSTERLAEIARAGQERDLGRYEMPYIRALHALMKIHQHGNTCLADLIEQMAHNQEQFNSQDKGLGHALVEGSRSLVTPNFQANNAVDEKMRIFKTHLNRYSDRNPAEDTMPMDLEFAGEVLKKEVLKHMYSSEPFEPFNILLNPFGALRLYLSLRTQAVRNSIVPYFIKDE